MNTIRRETIRSGFILETVCKDIQGIQSKRVLGWLDGGFYWTMDTPILFGTEQEAKNASQSGSDYSSYNSEWAGEKIRIFYIKESTVTTVTTEKKPIV